MLNQYNPQRYQLRHDGRKVGTIPVGSIVYPQDDWLNPVCRNPWIVEAWLNRNIGAATKTGEFYVDRCCVGGHLAQCRSLRDGRIKLIADHHLLNAIDSGLEMMV